MKTIEEVIEKMKHYHQMRSNVDNEQTIAFCDGVIQSLGWAYNLPYYDVATLWGEMSNGRRCSNVNNSCK